MAETNNGFMLFGGQRRLLARMDDTQKAALLDALYAFNDGEDVRPEDPLVDMAFMVIADAVRRCWERKEIFRENGSRGGRARRARSSEGPEGTDGNGEAGDGGSGAGAGPDKQGGAEVNAAEAEGSAMEAGAGGAKLRVPGKVKAMASPRSPRGAGGGYAADFEGFWSAYPRKVGKDAAWRAWKNRQREKSLPELPELLQALERARGCAQWQREGGQYIPHPATWLGQGRWMDEPPATEGVLDGKLLRRWNEEYGEGA